MASHPCDFAASFFPVGAMIGAVHTLERVSMAHGQTKSAINDMQPR